MNDGIGPFRLCRTCDKSRPMTEEESSDFTTAKAKGVEMLWCENNPVRPIAVPAIYSCSRWRAHVSYGV